MSNKKRIEINNANSLVKNINEFKKENKLIIRKANCTSTDYYAHTALSGTDILIIIDLIEDKNN